MKLMTNKKRRMSSELHEVLTFSMKFRFYQDKIYKLSIAQISFIFFIIITIGTSIYCAIASFWYGHAIVITVIEGVYAIHSGTLTGSLYFIVILLSLRYPFYWNWGLFNLGFDRQMKYHQLCAQLAAFCCIFHIIDHHKKLSFSNYASFTGFMCWIFGVLLVISSCSYFRRNHYNGLFMYTHWIFIPSFMMMGWLHNAIWIKIGVIIVFIDVIIRIWDNKFRKCTITDIKILDNNRVIKIEFEKKNFKYQAGQFINIRIPKIGLLEFHPFSLASYPSSRGPCFIYIQQTNTNKWCDKLVNYVNTQKLDLNELNPWYESLKVQIEGPFGALTLRKPLFKYKHVIFIAGGIGITPLNSLFNELINQILYAKIGDEFVSTQSINFAFTTRSKALIREFALQNQAWYVLEQNLSHNLDENGNDALLNNESIKSCEITSDEITSEDVAIGLNRTPRISFGKSRSKFTSLEIQKELRNIMIATMSVNKLNISCSTHITTIKDKELRKQYKSAYSFIKFNRPNIGQIIENAVSEIKSKDIAVLTSGPKSMINECIKWGKKFDVEVHFEEFQW